MPQLIEHLAELTGFRDRDRLDASVVRAINDVFHPHAVGIYRSIGDSGADRWLSRARMTRGETAPAADIVGTDVSALPLLDTVPERHRCLLAGEVTTGGEAGQWTYFPIATERAVVGVLEFEAAEPLSPKDRAMIVTILRIYGNFHDLLDHSERDPLTGLLNRQTFNSALMANTEDDANERHVVHEQRSRDKGTAIWLGIADIDHFKRVNDNFGHPIGDEVLLLLSRLLRSSFRHHDRLYRFGGEEFVVVLTCLTENDAAAAFERLRANVEQFSFPQVGHVTVSIGFTQTGLSETPTSAFARADKALYHVKERGRNAVALFEDLVKGGLMVEGEITGEVELF